MYKQASTESASEEEPAAAGVGAETGGSGGDDVIDAEFKEEK